MTNQSIRNELLDIFEDLTEVIDDGTYLKAMNLLGRIKLHNDPTINISPEIMQHLMDTLDGIEEPEPLGSRIIGENFLVTRPGMVFPILEADEKEYLTDKFQTSRFWQRLINNESNYIFNKETMRFVKRSSFKGREIIRKITVEQFPDLYMINPRNGRLVLKTY